MSRARPARTLVAHVEPQQAQHTQPRRPRRGLPLSKQSPEPAGGTQFQPGTLRAVKRHVTHRVELFALAEVGHLERLVLLLVEYRGALVDRLIEDLDGSLPNAWTWLHDFGLVEYCGDGWRPFYSTPVIEKKSLTCHL